MARLGLGTATFIPGYGLGAADTVPAAAIIGRALSRGVRYVDTAAVYADAERTLGAAAADLVVLDVRVATKMAIDPGVSAADVRQQAAASLGRLCRNRVDTVLLHNGSAAHLRDAGIVAGLQAVRRDGLAARIGASTYGVDDAREALEQPWCDVVQVEHSILNQSVLAAIGHRKRPDQEIVARSVLCKGLLTGRQVHATGLPADARQALASIERLAAEWGLTISSLAIRFALDTPGVDVVVVGVSSVEELDAALDAAAGAPLTEAQRSLLTALDRSALDIVHPERWAVAR